MDHFFVFSDELMKMPPGPIRRPAGPSYVTTCHMRMRFVNVETPAPR